jgi:NitT/TauT family transport system substrate-binding protein
MTSRTGKRRNMIRGVAALAALGLVTAACGGDDGETTAAPEEEGTETTAAGGEEEAPAGELTPVKLQLQWVTQAQFAGYFAADELGYYEEMGIDIDILEGGVDIVPQSVLAAGGADFAISWVPRSLASREQGAAITNISQVFQRSGTLQVSWADSGITGPADFAGKNIGNWGFGNEFELFAGMTAAGLDPGADVTLVQQSFDMQALLDREIDAAQAMIYNEYAQVLEAVNPETGELYQPEDLTVIDWNDEGTAMLQDAIWASTERLGDPEYVDLATRFVAASLQGWAYCRDNAQECADIVLGRGSELGASHQLWQMNEINKLIWPSPADGAGTMDMALWDQSVSIALETANAEGSTVLTAEPDAEALNTDINAAAIAMLTEMGIDVVGDGFEPIEVTLNEGGA